MVARYFSASAPVIAANKEQLLKDIAALVSINSVEGTPEEGAPYGAGPRAALDKTLELAAGMGLATRNCEGHIGYAELAGADAEKYLATICHVDVVPEGNGWTQDPFQMDAVDGHQCSNILQELLFVRRDERVDLLIQGLLHL